MIPFQNADAASQCICCESESIECIYQAVRVRVSELRVIAYKQVLNYRSKI